MNCCPCSETADERYARWDREASEAKVAALASPDTWVSLSNVVEDAGDNGTGGEYVDRQTEYMIVSDPDQPGDTEIWLDYIYETVNTEPARTDYDTYAKELAADSKAEDYPDPSNVAPSWALTS